MTAVYGPGDGWTGPDDKLILPGARGRSREVPPDATTVANARPGQPLRPTVRATRPPLPRPLGSAPLVPTRELDAAIEHRRDLLAGPEGLTPAGLALHERWARAAADLFGSSLPDGLPSILANRALHRAMLTWAADPRAFAYRPAGGLSTFANHPYSGLRRLAPAVGDVGVRILVPVQASETALAALETSDIVVRGLLTLGTLDPHGWSLVDAGAGEGFDLVSPDVCPDDVEMSRWFWGAFPAVWRRVFGGGATVDTRGTVAVEVGTGPALAGLIPRVLKVADDAGDVLLRATGQPLVASFAHELAGEDPGVGFALFRLRTPDLARVQAMTRLSYAIFLAALAGAEVPEAARLPAGIHAQAARIAGAEANRLELDRSLILVADVLLPQPTDALDLYALSRSNPYPRATAEAG